MAQDISFPWDLLQAWHGILKHSALFLMSLKMWQIDIFVRHNCGERKNIVGHHWSRCWAVIKHNLEKKFSFFFARVADKIRQVIVVQDLPTFLLLRTEEIENGFFILEGKKVMHHNWSRENPMFIGSQISFVDNSQLFRTTSRALLFLKY